VLRSLAIAFGFLTRIPVGRAPAGAAELGRAVTWFPAVGAALGAILVAGHGILDGVVAPALTATVVVALHAGLTGGLHLDGVADVFDALGGGRGQRDRMLAILRDSRIGAHGATALVFVLGAKVVAVVEILERQAAWALYASPAVARWAVVPLVVGFPYARPDGLGKAFHDQAGAAQLAGATAVAALAIGWVGVSSIAPALCALATALALACWLHRRLGGLTGDVYGAAIEVAELVFLIVAGRAGLE
jgi:adenosylcobinamide-GDP ribazoletransferase